MRYGIGRQQKSKGLLRLTFLAATAALALSACTTVEGTNAMVDPMTFEREVMRSTLQGVGIVPQEEKAMVAGGRSPLVVPASGSTPPPPTASAAVIPANSDRAVLDASNLTTADLQALRTGRVISSDALSGRPLTEAEARQLAARSAAANTSGQRSIYLPPAEYFQTVGGQSTVCQTATGAIVAITDPSCPAEVRAAVGQ
ncbi:hypothetical protein [Pelagibacterium luteolum]|uniref:Beta-barrel assembly machine subunit BamF n=1 Tax=Pelagibacterium luteolum TaxID=440168 RepID=A0A1G7TZW3_9HYPH|nr:hypothetical protein [Pelagibacterium luteolum]SDG40816.1 hypothetical protein SAMN04487974_102455 [Pelagibacterium luteolum]